MHAKNTTLKRKLKTANVENIDIKKKIKKKAVGQLNGFIKDPTAISEKTNNDDDELPSTTAHHHKLESSIFEHFKQLISAEENVRLSSINKLVLHLGKSKQDENKHQRELGYCLKRLIRGCGAATNASRAGFYSGLVALLKAFDAEFSLQQIFDCLEKELNVGATIANKEDADALVGRLLTCGAILHTNKLTQASNKELTQLITILLQSSKHRSYHSAMGYTFIHDLLQQLKEQQFREAVWTAMEQELLKSWPKQTLDSLLCLIAVQQRFGSILSAGLLKKYLGGTQLLNAESFAHWHRIIWQNQNANLLTHPGFEHLGIYMANDTNLIEFWTNTVDTSLISPTKLTEIKTLKIATDILQHMQSSRSNDAAGLLSPNFLKMLMQGLINLKQKKDDTTLQAFYEDFLEALVNCVRNITTTDLTKLSVIRKLVLPPGMMNIEKYTSTRIVHQLLYDLGKTATKEIYEIYKSIFVNSMPKNKENTADTWLNFERINAGYTLQHLLAHKSVQSSRKWRAQELSWLLQYGIFHMNEQEEVCKQDAAAMFSTDFAEQCKNMFYNCLQNKFTDLEQECKLLWTLVKNMQQQLLQRQKHLHKHLRIKQFGESEQKAWNNVVELVNKQQTQVKQVKPKEDGSKLELVFHILLLHMALQLFNESEMAVGAIDDLLKCYERSSTKTRQRQSEEEPHWMEVLVDLFLHLLSQNASSLRNIVNALFPHLCGNMTSRIAQQIMHMLDMTKNPLSAKGVEDEEDEDDDEEIDEDLNEIEKTVANEIESEEDDGEGEEDDEDDEDEDEDIDDDAEDADDDDITANEKLRNAVSEVLMQTGAAASIDDDLASVDLNDLTEEDGRKLDAALANAFKALKKTSDSGNNAENKKSKSFHIKTTSLLHFRIRILDLLEIYMQQQPKLFIATEIMITLCQELQQCISEDLQPLRNKIEKVLQKIFNYKCFVPETDLSTQQIRQLVQQLVLQKPPGPIFELCNRMRNSCIIFLMIQWQKYVTNETAEQTEMVNIWRSYLDEFIKTRNPNVNITLVSEMFKLRWPSIWQLALQLAQALNAQTRTFRRIQIYEICTVLYKNVELQRLDLQQTKQNFHQLEKHIVEHLQQQAQSSNVKQSLKEFNTMLEFMMVAQRTSLRWQLKSLLCTEQSCQLVQQLRRHIRLESTPIYQRYCATFKLPVIRNNEVKLPHAEQNGQIEEDEKRQRPPNKKAQKQKPNSKTTKVPERVEQKFNKREQRKEKKLKKQQRLAHGSRGLSADFGFVQKTQAQSDESSDVAD